MSITAVECCIHRIDTRWLFNLSWNRNSAKNVKKKLRPIESFKLYSKKIGNATSFQAFVWDLTSVENRKKGVSPKMRQRKIAKICQIIFQNHQYSIWICLRYEMVIITGITTVIVNDCDFRDCRLQKIDCNNFKVTIIALVEKVAVIALITSIRKR